MRTLAEIALVLDQLKIGAHPYSAYPRCAKLRGRSLCVQSVLSTGQHSTELGPHRMSCTCIGQTVFVASFPV